MVEAELVTYSDNCLAILETISGVNANKLLDKENVKWLELISFTFRIKLNNDTYCVYHSCQEFNTVLDGEWIYTQADLRTWLIEIYNPIYADKKNVQIVREEILIILIKELEELNISKENIYYV